VSLFSCARAKKKPNTSSEDDAAHSNFLVQERGHVQTQDTGGRENTSDFSTNNLRVLVHHILYHIQKGPPLLMLRAAMGNISVHTVLTPSILRTDLSFFFFSFAICLAHVSLALHSEGWRTSPRKVSALVFFSPPTPPRQLSISKWKETRLDTNLPGGRATVSEVWLFFLRIVRTLARARRERRTRYVQGGYVLRAAITHASSPSACWPDSAKICCFCG